MQESVDRGSREPVDAGVRGYGAQGSQWMQLTITLSLKCSFEFKGHYHLTTFQLLITIRHIGRQHAKVAQFGAIKTICSRQIRHAPHTRRTLAQL